MVKDLQFITQSLSKVLANGHALVPVPHQDLRILVEAADQTITLHDALNGLLGYAEEGCPDGGYSAIIEARAALKNFRVLKTPDAAGEATR